MYKSIVIYKLRAKIIMLKLNLKTIFANLKRVVLTVLACSLFLVANTSIAAAVTSSPEKGEAHLNDIQKRTDMLDKQTRDISRGDRSVYPSLKQTQEAANKGPNEIQGDADLDKMISPEDVKNKNEATAEDKVTDIFSKITNSK
jgi:hypothetical protein